MPTFSGSWLGLLELGVLATYVVKSYYFIRIFVGWGVGDDGRVGWRWGDVDFFLLCRQGLDGAGIDEKI